MSLTKIFFSYSRVDASEFALKLALDLKEQGFDVWIDQQNIRAGSEWDLEIEKALETCDCLLFLESEKSVSSNNVLDEVYYALEQHKKVIPVIIHDSKTPYRLQRLQHIDFSKDYNKGFLHLVNELKSSSGEDAEPDNLLKEKPVSFLNKISTFTIVVVLILLIVLGAVFYLASNKKVTVAADKETLMSPENFAGNWELISVEPKANIGKGYLKIEINDSKKVTVNSSFQFYYLRNNDTSFLNVLNGFAGCPVCELKQEMKLVTDDIAIGSQIYKTSKIVAAGKKIHIDTVANQGYNQSIRAKSSLKFTGEKNAEIKVYTDTTILLNSGLVLTPFTYIFQFKKIE